MIIQLAIMKKGEKTHSINTKFHLVKLMVYQHVNKKMDYFEQKLKTHVLNQHPRAKIGYMFHPKSYERNIEQKKSPTCFNLALLLQPLQIAPHGPLLFQLALRGPFWHVWISKQDVMQFHHTFWEAKKSEIALNLIYFSASSIDPNHPKCFSEIITVG